MAKVRVTHTSALLTQAQADESPVTGAYPTHAGPRTFTVIGPRTGKAGEPQILAYQTTGPTGEGYRRFRVARLVRVKVG